MWGAQAWATGVRRLPNISHFKSFAVSDQAAKWNPRHRLYEGFRVSVTKYIVATGSAFRSVEDPHFRAMCNSLNVSAPNLSAKAISKCVSVQAQKLKEKLIGLNLARFRPCLLADGWSQRPRHWFAMGAVYIHRDPDQERFSLERISMGTWSMPGNVNADQIATKMEQIRAEYGLSGYR